MIISALAGTRCSLVSHFTTRSGLPRIAETTSSSSARARLSFELETTQVTGSCPSAIDTLTDFSPRSRAFMNACHAPWPSSGFTPSRRGPLISQR